MVLFAMEEAGHAQKGHVRHRYVRCTEHNTAGGSDVFMMYELVAASTFCVCLCCLDLDTGDTHTYSARKLELDKSK